MKAVSEENDAEQHCPEAIKIDAPFHKRIGAACALPSLLVSLAPGYEFTYSRIANNF